MAHSSGTDDNHLKEWHLIESLHNSLGQQLLLLLLLLLINSLYLPSVLSSPLVGQFSVVHISLSDHWW